MVEWTVQKMRFKNLLRLAGIVILFVGLWHLLAPVTPMPTWTAYAELVPTIPGRTRVFYLVQRRTRVHNGDRCDDYMVRVRDKGAAYCL